jgi:hypothetical protein
MQFTRDGEYLAVSRVTGPTHNLLQVRLEVGPQGAPVCEKLPAVGRCVHEPLNEQALVACVLEGVAEANSKLGTSYSVASIRYVDNDTKPEKAYAYMAYTLVERLADGHEYVSVGSQVGQHTI